MTELQRKQRNADRLLELFPTFRARIAKVITDLEAMGVRPRIQDGYRTPADQLIAFNSGHSKLKFGFHNVTGRNGEKESLAVDMLDDDNPVNLSKSYLLKLAFISEENGLITGIRWGVPVKLIAAIDKAIAEQDWNANVKIGWDPSHIQPTGLTVSEAKGGKRPV
ncbi:MAG: hypothetical protein ABI675_19680 [Chitinophagaceae bacterium]